MLDYGKNDRTVWKTYIYFMMYKLNITSVYLTNVPITTVHQQVIWPIAISRYHID